MDLPPPARLAFLSASYFTLIMTCQNSAAAASASCSVLAASRWLTDSAIAVRVSDSTVWVAIMALQMCLLEHGDRWPQAVWITMASGRQRGLLSGHPCLGEGTGCSRMVLRYCSGYSHTGIGVGPLATEAEGGTGITTTEVGATV